MLSLDALDVSYDGHPAVVGATLEVPDGEVVAVLGPSGCGKSTLLRAVAGLEPPSAGTISWDGDDLARVPTHKRGFALMFQDGQLFGHLTVARNVGYALRVRRAPGAAARVDELLAVVGLEGYGDRLPATLSGGERQRVALARSLAADPRLLLLDEPLSALDAGLRERLAADLGAILRASRATTLLVTHDQEEAFALADRLVVMRAGRIVQQGPTADVWARPADAATALFLGYARVLDGAPAAAVLAAAGVPGAGRGLDTPDRPGASKPAPGDGPRDHGRPTGPEQAGPVQVAVRRSALTLDDAGPLRGVVVEVRATPDQVRLVVRVDGVGELDAVAGPSSHAGPGDEVRLAVDPARTAVISDGS